ncbi:uncharacterized protein [Macrobrachium rosenbergii]|uniref:uncharacterized protein n=1 Tax=Macrobrachium rosenbergii TaxID=79674 RepID=UPI0034D3E753
MEQERRNKFLNKKEDSWNKKEDHGKERRLTNKKEDSWNKKEDNKKEDLNKKEEDSERRLGTRKLERRLMEQEKKTGETRKKTHGTRKKTRKAAYVASQLSGVKDYEGLKKTVLDAYAITVEGYRQTFRNSFKTQSQTFVEFCNIKVKLILKPASLADDYYLIHKNSKDSSKTVSSPKSHQVSCAYCKKDGHSIENCPSPKCQRSEVSTGGSSVLEPKLIVTTPEVVIKDELSKKPDKISQVITRSSSKMPSTNFPPKVKNDRITEALDLVDINKDQFAVLQQKDSSLKALWDKVVDPTDNPKSPYFYVEKNILFRHYKSPKAPTSNSWHDCFQVVFPEPLRKPLLDLAHSTESHLGVNKTYKRLRIFIGQK